MTDNFTNLYKRLNKAQKDAVDSIEGPIMVIAGPGTGKTTILTLRIANILKQTDTPPNGILAITYTDAGVKAMREKLVSIIGDRAHEVRIHTFHGFASSVINEHPDHFIHIQDMKQMTEIEQELLIKNIIDKPEFSDIRPLGKPDAYIRSIIGSIDDAKRDNLKPSDVKSFAEKEIKRIENDEDSISSRGATKGKLKALAIENIEKCKKTILFSKVYEIYEIEKEKNKKLDFNDLITNLVQGLKKDEQLLRLIQEQYLYIHIDEHQDTNDSQNSIISMIADFFDTPNIFIVGDEKQAIYRFQGASVENFLLLKKKWPDMKLISLDTNYRSKQNILDASFKMIENNYEENENKELRIPLKGHKINSDIEEDKNSVTIVNGNDIGSIEHYLIQEVQNIRKTKPESSIAIITRRNRELDRVIRLFEQNNIPISSERSIDIFHHPIGILYFDLLEYIYDSNRIDMLSKTIVSGMWNISFEKSLKVLKDIKSGNIENIEEILSGISKIRKEINNDSSINFLINIASYSGYIDIVAKDPIYINVWKGILSLAESLVNDANIHSPLEIIKSLLAYRTSAETKMIKVSVGAPDTNIFAMTAHGSKGLEFDYVFIPYANEDTWIGKNRGSSFVLPKKQASFSDVKDLRRLFYVAITRAKNRVIILNSLEEIDGKILTPLRFLSELPNENIEYINIEKSDDEKLLNKKEKDFDKERENKIIDISKNVLLEKGLSVTALNHFLNCENTFIYQSILKLPQPLTTSSEKGNAMHDALSKVWTLSEKTEENILNKILERISEYLKQSYLETQDKERVKKELIENAPSVAKSLLSHFQTKGTVYTEHWVENSFSYKYKDQIVKIPIHGKLDAIIDNGNEVYVFDYKTRKAMSESSIKGDTKNSDGGYFRQLVFYYILLRQDPRFKTKRIIPSLVFISPDEKGRCPIISLPISDDDIKKVNEEINSLIESVWSGDIVKQYCDDSNCEWCTLKRAVLKL
jgi:DNA helicase-2/ATP-dependent DNA helicase PcrA